MHPEPQLALEGWLALLYEDLRERAALYLRRPSPVVSIRPTELVHEAYLRIVNGGVEKVSDQGHLFAIASVAMRQILVDEARARRAAKRGGGWQRLTLEDVDHLAGRRPVDILAVDQILTRLERLDDRAARIVEMKVFGGFTDIETGEALGISDRWVRRQWSHAKAWLRTELTQAGN
jgi:RNA polymerase sigma factor (TIGR02999 family)